MLGAGNCGWCTGTRQYYPAGERIPTSFIEERLYQKFYKFLSELPRFTLHIKNPSLASQPTSALREGFGQLSIQVLSLDNTDNCHSGSAENCSLEVARSTKNWRKSRYFYSWEERISLLLCQLDRLQQKLLPCILVFFMGQMTTRWHRPSCVTTRCCHEGPGSLEERMVNVSLFASPIAAALRCTY